MKRFLVLVVSLVASLVGILAPASATELPSASVVTYTYDGHHAPAQFAAAAPQRGPPVAYDVNSYDADDLRPLGALARSDGPAPVSTTITYVNPGTSVRVARDTTPTGSWVGPTVENPSSFQRSAIAANAAPKALAASTRAAPWAGSTLSRLSREGEVMYRVYGGGAGKAGSWLTPINPASSAAARQGLGLPAENAALYVSRVTLPGGVRMQVGTAFGGDARGSTCDRAGVDRPKPRVQQQDQQHLAEPFVLPRRCRLGRGMARPERILMTEAVTNLRVLKPSRKKPKPGDVFALQLAGEEFLFGRVISTDAKWTLAEGAGPSVLIYIFRERSGEKAVPDAAVMRPDHLLVSPIMTNQLPWSRGYFETLANIPLTAADILPQHCFLSASRGRYFDEHGVELPGPIEPVGDHGLHSFRTIDDQVSDALGVPRAPEE